MNLLESVTVGPLTLDNRVLMAPMTRNRAPEAQPNDMMATYYRQRASAGLIVTEATQVDPQGQGYPNTPGIYNDEQVKGWKAITDAVHEEGGRIFLQLWHVGRISHSSFHGGDKPVAPSAIAPEGETMTATFEMEPFETPRALETEEIPGIIDMYRRGARLAKEAGFDGVEVHGANGYLLDQFLTTGSNKRTDEYGGSLENRARLLLEVTDAVIDEWGSDRVGVRLSPAGTFNSISDDNRVETFTYVAEQLNGRGLAYLHLVEGELDDRKASGVLRDVYEGTLIAAGDYDRESGEKALDEDRLDAIVFGRPFISNPDLPKRFAQDAELNDWNTETFYGGDEEGYIDYPTLEEQEGVAA